MIILLDTNALVWLLDDSSGEKFGTNAKEFLQSADTVYASAVNVLEIRIKSMLGKLKAPATLVNDITAAGLNNLPFSEEHADAINKFPNLAKQDPFDRMLLAQAQAERICLLTSDKQLVSLGLDFVLNARN